MLHFSVNPLNKAKSNNEKSNAELQQKALGTEGFEPSTFRLPSDLEVILYDMRLTR